MKNSTLNNFYVEINNENKYVIFFDGIHVEECENKSSAIVKMVELTGRTQKEIEKIFF